MKINTIHKFSEISVCIGVTLVEAGRIINKYSEEVASRSTIEKMFRKCTEYSKENINPVLEKFQTDGLKP